MWDLSGDLASEIIEKQIEADDKAFNENSIKSNGIYPKDGVYIEGEYEEKNPYNGNSKLDPPDCYIKRNVNKKKKQDIKNIEEVIKKNLSSLNKDKGRGENMIKIVKEYSDKIKNDRKPIEIALQVSSETGELMDEVRRSEVPGFYKKPGVDGVLGESCDVMIAVLDLLFKKGYTEDDINNTIKKKCEKWYNKMTSKQDNKKEEIPKNENETIAKILNRIIHMNYPRYIHQNSYYSMNFTLLDHFRESLKKQIETLDNNEHINVSFPILNRNLFVGDRCIIDFDALTISIVILNYQIENLDLYKLQNKLQDMYLPLSNLENSDEKYGDYKKLENVHCIHFENLDKIKEFVSKYDNIKDFLIDLYPEMTNYIHSIYR